MDWGVVLLLIGLWVVLGVWALAPRITRRRAQRHAGLSASEHALAQERSLALLHDLLDENELQQLTQQGYLDVASPSTQERVYRIPRNAGRVLLFEHGQARVELCVQSVEPLPANDVIALHKLMIMGNEQGYLARANQIPLALPQHLEHRAWWGLFTL